MRADLEPFGVLLLSMAVVLGGCGGDTEDLGEPVDFESEVQPIFNNCVCHLQNSSGEMEADYMTLNPGRSYDQIVDVRAAEAPLVRVAPGDLDGSYLWHKLQGTQEEVGGRGDQMPPKGVPRPTDEQIATIESWIRQGAKP